MSGLLWFVSGGVVGLMTMAALCADARPSTWQHPDDATDRARAAGIAEGMRRERELSMFCAEAIDQLIAETKTR